MTNNIAVYAGTFDPITLGHVDIIKRAAKLFDQLVIGVAKSERKKPFFDLEKRVTLVQAALSDLDSVTVKVLPGLTIDFAKEHRAQFLLRGLRSSVDYEYEAAIAQMNSTMSENKIETIFFPTHPDYSFVSSSIVRELIFIKAFDQLERFVPAVVLDLLR